MKKMKWFIATLIVMCGIILLQLPTLAAQVSNSTTISNKDSIQAGDMVEITMSLDNYSEIEKGINALKATLEYDTNIFQEVQQADFNTLNSWEELYYNPVTRQFVTIKKAGSKIAEQIVTIRLQAKETVTAGQGLIRIKDITVSEGINDLFTETSQVLVNIQAQTVGEQGSQDNFIVSNDMEITETAPTKVNPMTGDKLGGIIAISAAAVIVCGIIIFISLYLRKKGFAKGFKAMLGIAIVGVISTVAVNTAYALGGKGDLNGDGKVDYSDVILLEKHLISLQTLPEDKLNAADMNSDGILTVTDLSLLIQNVENTLDYTVSLTSTTQNFYPNKNEEIQLRFQGEVSYNGEIVGVIINSEEYQPVRVPNSSEYMVTLPASDVAGVQTFHFTKVRLHNNREINVDFTEQVDVLKTAPSIENFRTEELSDSAQMKVTFDIKDDDGSITSSEMQILKNSDSGMEVIDSKSVRIGTNEFILDLQDGIPYTLNFCLEYNLDSDLLTDHEEDHSETMTTAKEVQLNLDYRFMFDNLKIYNETQQETTIFGKNEPIVLSFESTNATRFKPVNIKVNGTVYPLVENEGVFSATLNGFDTIGIYQLQVEEVILENGKIFVPEQGNTVSVSIEKEAPKFSQVNVEEHTETSSVFVSFQIQDPDQALFNKKVIIKDDSGKIVAEKVFEDNLFQEELSIPDELSTKYVIQVVSDCDTSVDGSGLQTEKVVFETSITAVPKVKVISHAPEKDYLEKGEQAAIFYEMESNVSQEIRKFIVNNTEVLAEKQSNGTYKAVIPLQNTSGKQLLVLSKVIFADNTAVNTNITDEVEVLKSAPVIEDYQEQDDANLDQIHFTFTVTDPDQAFISGNVQLIDDAGEIAQEQTIQHAGENTVSLSVAEDALYTLKILLSYQRTEDGSQIENNVNVLERDVQLIRNYNLQISDIASASEQGTKTVYFEKNGTINVSFTAQTNSTVLAEKVLVNGTEYSLTSLGNHRYQFTMNGFPYAGIQKLTLEKLWMNNSKELEIPNDTYTQVEILKEKPKVINFSSEQTDADQLKLTFDLVDPDNALTNAKLIVSDGTNTLLNETINAGAQKEALIDLTSSQSYHVSVVADYDRDTNTFDQNSNQAVNDEIFKETVSASKDVIEFKNITRTQLYHRADDGTAEEVDILDITGGVPQDLNNYYAVIEMENLPTFYAGIQSFRQDTATDKLMVVIDQKDLVQYVQDGAVRKNEFSFEIAYKDQQGVHTSIKDATEFFKEISLNLSGDYELREDLDASAIPADTAAAIMGNFRGTINGNGHKIFNLHLPLFQTVDGATIQNLVIEDAYITSDAKGILSTTIQGNSVIENTYIVNSSLLGNTNQIGTFAGVANGSTIRNSAAISISIKGTDTIGGITGQISNGTVIENCYVTGTLQGTRSQTPGARIGGITGWHSGKSISHCFTKVNIIAPSQTGNGGIIGGPQQGNVNIDHSLSMSTGDAYRIAGFNTLNQVSQVYEYALSDSASNINEENQDGVMEITDISDPTFFEDTLGFDTDIWDLDLVQYGKLPSQHEDPMPKELLTYEIQENINEIPNYSQVRNHLQYRKDKETAYANMSKLMPFAETNVWVEYGNQIEDTDLLSTNKVKFVLPLDSGKGLVTGVEKQNPQTIAFVRIVFEDGQNMDLAVGYQKMIGDVVAVYQVDNNNLQYQFNRYVADIDAAFFSELVSQADSYDYATIEQLTQEADSRLYADYYTETVKPEIESLLTKLITSQEYPTYFKNTWVQEQLQKQLKDEMFLQRVLYAYNYYDKWYRIDFNGVNLSDLLFFNGTLLTPELSMEYLVGSVVDGAQNLRQTSNTVVFYDNVLRGFLGKEMMDFLAELSKSVAGYDNPSDWFKANFDGILEEQQPYTDNENIEYRIWDIMNHLGDRKKIVLPILTAPQQDMYLISTSSQLVIGSMNRYSQYMTKDGAERQRMEEIIHGYSERLGHFYGVSSNWISNSEQILNSFTNIQYDTRFNFPQSSAADAGDQSSGTTKDPVIKWVYEAIGSWGNKNGSGAYANGTDVYWIAECALGGDYAFYIFSHETAHNQDGKYFYGGSGRRIGSGPEAHADGNIAQQIEDGSMVFNISTVKDVTADVTNNFSYERINTPDKLKSYYQEMFETSYVLEYLQGQAFLQLTPAEQAAVAIQVNERKDGNSITSDYTRLTEDDFREMDLRTMDDLWNHRIALKAAGSFASSNYGAYGYETFYDSNWYQQHNDSGTPGSSTFKRLGQEMLGIGGYEDGYVVYMSRKSSSDLDALRKITKDPTITWQTYKQSRYANVEQNLENISYFNTDEAIKMFKEAFEQDAAAGNGKRNNSNAVKRTLFGIVKRATNDFTDGTVYQTPTVTPITTAEQLIELANNNSIGNYRLEADLDFSHITPEQAYYISNRFIGVLDGNHHKITGLQYPLFNQMIYAEVKNLTIEKPVYQSGSTAILSRNSKNVVVDTVQVKGSDVQLPLVASKTGAYYECGNINIEVVPTEIHTEDEFLAIGSSDISRTKAYVLMANLDFTDKQFTTSAIPGVFTGQFNGNGHTISNLNAVVFENLANATVENLGISGSTVTENSNKGVLSNHISNSTIQKVYLSDITLSSTSNQVGGLAGVISLSTITEVSLENINISADNTVGGIAGQIDGSSVENCLVTGKVKGTLNHAGLGARAAGITGWLRTDSFINNCFVNVQIESPKAQGSGGLIGGPNSGNVRIENSVSLSTGANAFRIAGFNVLNQCANIYELEGSSSTTNMNEGNTGKVKSVTSAHAQEKSFYVTDLGWSETIWDFTNITSGNPRLKNAFVTPKVTVEAKQSVMNIHNTESQEEKLDNSSGQEVLKADETEKKAS